MKPSRGAAPHALVQQSRLVSANMTLAPFELFNALPYVIRYCGDVSFRKTLLAPLWKRLSNGCDVRLGCCILLTGLSLLTGTMSMPRAYARAIGTGVIPNARACIIPSDEPGQSTTRALQLVGPTPFAAQAIWGPGYPPTIIYS